MDNRANCVMKWLTASNLYLFLQDRTQGLLGVIDIRVRRLTFAHMMDNVTIAFVRANRDGHVHRCTFASHALIIIVVMASHAHCAHGGMEPHLYQNYVLL